MTAATLSDRQAPAHQSEAPLDIAHAIAAVPAGSGDAVVCFSARDSGLWRSEDGGASFQQVVGSPGEPVTAACLAFAPDFASSRTVLAGAAGSILRSIDGGQRWRSVELPAPPPFVTCLAFSPDYAVDGVVLAGTLEDGVLRSDDRGERWRRWNFGLLDLSVYALVASPAYATDETIFAGTETALFRSENGGRSWRETAFPEAAAPVLALAVSGQGVVWAGTDQQGIWRSSDNGATWERSDDGAITIPVNQLLVANDAVLAALPDAVVCADGAGRALRHLISGMSDSGGIAGMAVPDSIGEESELFIQLRHGPVRRLRIGHFSESTTIASGTR